MVIREKLLNKYIDRNEVTNWFLHKNYPSAETIGLAFSLAAQDYKSKKLSYSNFFLICTNLYFEGVVMLTLSERRSIPKRILTAMEAFADPTGDLIDENGKVLTHKQNEILKAYFSENLSV